MLPSVARGIAKGEVGSALFVSSEIYQGCPTLNYSIELECRVEARERFVRKNDVICGSLEVICLQAWMYSARYVML